jgi:hypothetical protein
MAACDCVPDINTPKIIEPSSSSEVMFVNAMPDLQFIFVQADIEYNNLLDYNASSGEYNTLSSFNSVSLASDEDFNNIIYRRQTEFLKGFSYTFIFSGQNRRVKEVLIHDTLDSYNPSSSYIRFINCGQNCPGIRFELVGSYSTSYIPVYSYTTFIEMTPGNYNLNVKTQPNDSTIISISNISLNAGESSSYILQGYYEGTLAKALKVRQVSHELKNSQ